MHNLDNVQSVRRDPGKEMQPLQQILADFEAGRVGSRRLISAAQDLSNRRRESNEGKFEIDTAVTRAADMLREMSALLAVAAQRVIDFPVFLFANVGNDSRRPENTGLPAPATKRRHVHR